MVDFIKYAFVAGEISPTLFGRSDLEKYDLGMAECRNYFVDYRGGLSTRPGSLFLDYVLEDDKPTRFLPFKFAPSVDRTYVLLFGHEYIRFLQDGAYVLEDEVTITDVTQADPGVVTAAAHGFSDGDWVKVFEVAGMTELNQRTFQVGGATTNTFQLINPLTGANIDTTGYTAYSSGGVVQRIYTLTSPYDADDLELLRAHQSRSAVYLTREGYAPRKLVRTAHTNWTLAEESFGNGLSAPTGLAITVSSAGTAGVGFRVTSVNADGVESVASDFVFNSATIDYTQAAGQAKVSWSAVPGAVQYRVYRTNVITTGADLSRAMQVGFVGFSFGTEFIDNNIIPDFTITPPNHRDPFAHGAIEHIEVTAAGTGYTNASVVSITTSTGSGFIGYPVVNSAGNLLAIVIENSGKGYEAGDTVSVSVGTGATFSITLGEASGNEPAVSSVFQQRKVYAASTNDPLTIWGSKPSQYANFDESDIIQEDDAYEFEIDSDEVAPIRHMIATRSGLVIMSQAGIWQLTGGQGVAVTPTNALADPQSYTGCSILQPLLIDTDILYNEGKGATVRLLQYNDYSKVFASQDLSILSNHLTTPLNRLVYWTYASDPFKLVHSVREDGRMVVLTLVKEQNVYGWTSWQTRGLYKDVIAIQEDLTDTVYMMVQRYVNGRYTKMLEKLVRREFEYVEDAWCVDCGLSLGETYPAADLTISATTGTGVTVTASAAIFASGDVGKIIRAGGGKMEITSFTSATEVMVTILRDIEDILPETPADEDDFPLPVRSGNWTMDTPVSSVSGLWHLIGQKVKVFADGSVQADKTVDASGSITLDVPATRVTVGLGFKCVAKTLPPTTTEAVIEGKIKRPVRALLRVHQSRGLKVGWREESLYPFKERTDEIMGEPTRMQAGLKEVSFAAPWNLDGQFVIVEEDPLPSTILGFIADVEIGDVGSK